MRNSFKLLIMLLTTNLYYGNAHGNLINIDLLEMSSPRLVNYHNSASGLFKNSQDSFQIFPNTNRGIPDILIDNTISGSSQFFGIITPSNPSAFFGVTDTINSDNKKPVSANWQFDISGLERLHMRVDIAAMGNFESSDWFSWHYSFDNSPEQLIFSSVVDESISQTYQLGNGVLTKIDDPLIVNNALLSNQFKPFFGALSGQGKKLNVTLRANTNGSDEAFAFQNIQLQAETSVITNVNEPQALLLMIIALIIILVKRRNHQFKNRDL